MKKDVDMLNGPLAGKILAVALPLAAIQILQQLFYAADVAVVGRFASATALAAVGANTPIVNMFITFFTGLATGGNVAISTSIGRGDQKGIKRAVDTVFTLSLISAVVVLLLGQTLARPLLGLLNTPENIIDQALLYLRIYLFSIMFLVIYNFTSAILRSKGDTRRPLYCLIGAGILNVILNLIFVILLHMDVAGVALATLISNMVCAGATILILWKEDAPLNISLQSFGIHRDALLYTLRIGFPAGIQGMLFSISNMIIQTGINSFGSDCIAGNTAAMNFEFIAFFVVNAFGQTATTFTSQNYGAKKADHCKKIFQQCLGMALGFCITLCFILFLGKNFFLGFFSKDQAVLSYAFLRLYYVVLLEFMTAFNEIPSSCLRGMGISLPPTIISIMGSCVFRIVWVRTIFRTVCTTQVLMLVYPVSWVLIGICSMTFYLVMRKKCLSFTTHHDLIS